MSDKRKVTIYTDGGADPNPGPGGWGVVFIDEETGAIKELTGGEPHTTNNRMELTAACVALETLKVPCAVTLYTDSTYLKNGITKWLPGWVKRGWKRKGGKLKNVDLWQRLAAVVEEHDIAWKWVKGHAGNTHNERADQLATQGIRAHYAEQHQQPTQQVTAYTMSSARGNTGTWATLVRHEGDGREFVLWGEEKGYSSNALEVVAAIEALSPLEPGTRARVYTRNDYLRNGASKWRKGWKRRNWRKKSGDPIANQELWQHLDDILTQIEVEWPPVKDEALQLEFEDVGRRVQEEIQMQQELDNPDTYA
jgi:ribonuclease HI